MNLSYKVGDDPVTVQKNRAVFFSDLRVSEQQLANPHQVHSASVRTVTLPGEYEACDALITNRVGVALGVTIADCVPILLFDPVRKAIGIVHAGWRGTSQEIAVQTIEQMRKDFGVEPAHIRVFIGPSAGACCYEVGEDVAVKFKNKIVSFKTKRTFVDLKKENAAQFVCQGVNTKNIEVSRHCTICESGLFHSFRRDGATSGRMMAVICRTS